MQNTHLLVNFIFFLMKYMFLATEDNKMQLMHILLNANHFHDSGHKVAIVLECASSSLLIGIEDGSIKLPLFNKAMENGIIDHACKACTAQFSATEAAQKLGVPIMGELQGHSNLLRFVEEGYSIIRF